MARSHQWWSHARRAQRQKELQALEIPQSRLAGTTVGVPRFSIALVQSVFTRLGGGRLLRAPCKCAAPRLALRKHNTQTSAAPSGEKARWLSTRAQTAAGAPRKRASVDSSHMPSERRPTSGTCKSLIVALLPCKPSATHGQADGTVPSRLHWPIAQWTEIADAHQSRHAAIAMSSLAAGRKGLGALGTPSTFAETSRAVCTSNVRADALGLV